jgi:uncharacterized protein
MPSPFIAGSTRDTFCDMEPSVPILDSSPVEREAALVAWLGDVRTAGVLIGFSGGVDSSYLAAVALQVLGATHVLAVTGRSPTYPEEQWETARAVVAQLGLPHLELDTRELEDARYVSNSSNRCYFCKSELWTRLAPLAASRGMVLVDGTNADDLADYRPGAQAAREAGVRSPLADVGLTKSDIRRLSSGRGLPTADQPSSPCLASRIPYGTSVTIERLARVERAERQLRAIGVAGDLRVRFHGDLARVELSPSELDRWLTPAATRQLRDAVRAAGFSRVAIDLRGFRSGSLNVLSGVTGD